MEFCFTLPWEPTRPILLCRYCREALSRGSKQICLELRLGTTFCMVFNLSTIHQPKQDDGEEYFRQTEHSFNRKNNCVSIPPGPNLETLKP